MEYNLFAQVIGIVAVLSSLIIFQLNNRQKMLRLAIVGGLLYTIHFYLLGAFTGAAMNFLSVGRSYVFVKVKPSRHNRWILYVFIGLATLATILTWQGFISLLPLLGNTANALAFWQRKPKLIRRWAFMAPPLWFVYNALSGSYPGMFIEAITMASLMVGAYRFDHHHKSHIHRHLSRPA